MTTICSNIFVSFIVKAVQQKLFVFIFLVVDRHLVLYATGNDPRPQMIPQFFHPRPELIPEELSEWNGMTFNSRRC